MSYDLHLFRPPPGADLAAAGLHSFQHEGDGPATPASKARKRALADALLRHDPRLTVLAEDWPATSHIPPPVELAANDENGIRVLIFDRTAALELPYARGEAAWERARGYLRVLEEAGGFRTFDPQTGEVLDLGTVPTQQDTDGYRRGNAVVQRILDASDDPSDG
ncbi:MAG TPA: hypothetical protein VLK84_11235 [Longimicrobium sp.]|nr:hypothetical protein [Longimicrobium sp.]